MLTCHQNITCDIIDENPDMPWRNDALNLNPNITWEFIIKRQDINWDYRTLLYYVELNDLAWDFIFNNLNKPWDWSFLSIDEKIDFDFVKNNIGLRWDWAFLSLNKNITWDIVLKNIHLPWDWNNLSQNSNISWDIIKSYPEKQWAYDHLIDNDSLMFSFDLLKDKVIRHKIGRNNVSIYEFYEERELFQNQNYLKYMAAYRIQQWWYRISLSPKYKIGRKLIEQRILNTLSEAV